MRDMADLIIDAQALLADLAGLAPKPSGRTCHAAHAIEALDGPIGAAVEAVMDRTDIPASDVCRVLAKNGVNINLQSLRRHRRRGEVNGCACPRVVTAPA